jgi:nitrite reductase/ring-hydroxylating ferredoxin subunit
MADERRASRRDLFRLIGRTLADAAGKRVSAAPVRSAPAPAEELPVHPIPPGFGKRFRHPGGTEAILLARVTPEHLAAVGGDCPHCGGPLSFDGKRDAVLCPAGGATFRLDGCVIEGPGYLRLRSYPCRRTGPRVEIDPATT